MSDLIVAPVDSQDLVEEYEHFAQAVSQQPVISTGQAIAFSTAAAMPLPRTKAACRVIAGLRAMFLSSSESPRPPLHHYPPRFYAFPRMPPGNEKCTGCDHVPDHPRPA